MSRRLGSLLAALVIGGAGLVVGAGPAAAAACPQGTGVTVVVGSSTSCDKSGGDAASHFTRTGHSLTYVQRQPGFVCQVDGAPASAACVNTPPSDAYWGLFWSDGKSGSWTYASQGVTSLSVPAGGWVALVFQSSDSKKPPSVKPVGPAPATKPSTGGGGSGGSGGGGSTGSGGSGGGGSTGGSGSTGSGSSAAPTAGAPAASPSASTKATPKPAKKTTPRPSPKTTATPTAAPSATSDVVTDDPASTTSSEVDEGSGSLGWLAGALALALVGGMGFVLWRRRAAGGPS